MSEPPEIIMPELYDRPSSEFYDSQGFGRPDVPFYVGIARETGGPVLELGCGTGRILIPTARAGVEITGMDKSNEMLRICRAKLEDEETPVKTRVQLVQGDIRSFDLHRAFSLVTITFGPFNNLVSVDEQLSCLACVRQHLGSGGRLVFDVYHPKPDELNVADDTELFTTKTPAQMPDGRSFTWGIRYRHVDVFGQVIHDDLFFNVRYPDGRLERLVYPEELRFFFRFEVEHLLARAGFAVESVYGDFARTPFGVAPPGEMVIVARRA